MTRAARWSWALCASCLVHGALWAHGVRASRAERREAPPRDLELRWVALAPAPEPPAPEPVVEPPPAAKPEPVARPTVKKVAEAAPPEPAPPAAPPPVASEPLAASQAPAPGPDIIAAVAAPGAFGFSAGSGGARGGGIATPVPAAVPKPSGPPVVPLSDLSRRPRAPSLDRALRHNYPAELRRRGVEGVAEVGLVVNAAGRVARVEILSETAGGFADACRATLLGTEWTPPLDRTGSPVATRLKYRCRFEVEGR